MLKITNNLDAYNYKNPKPRPYQPAQTKKISAKDNGKKQLLPVFNVKSSQSGRRQRMWQKIEEKGAQVLSDQEILEICLYITNSRKDTYGLAKVIMKHFGSIANCISANRALLLQIPGVSDKTVASFSVLAEFCRRFTLPSIMHKNVISSWMDVIKYARLAIGHKNQEHVLSLFLDSKNQLIKEQIHQIGTNLMVYIYPEELVKQCVILDASALIIVHNHPTNNINPSEADVHNTQKLQKMLNVVNVSLHDHIIIGTDKFFSFRTEKLLV